jgi:hypothetical protein
MHREEEHRIISLRQSRITELLAQGYTNQSEIARKLNVSEPTVSRDIQFLNRQAQENLRFHIEERIPLEIESCFLGHKIVIRKAYEIVNSPDAKYTERLGALHLISNTYEKMREVLADESLTKEIINKVKEKQNQLEQWELELERRRQRAIMVELGIDAEETEDPNRVA